MRWFIQSFVILSLGLILPASHAGMTSEYTVYSVYRGLNLGGTEELPQKDYYINMGAVQGLREGALLEVLRHVPSYDLSSERLVRDVSFPIALVRVIHVESRASIARLERMLPSDRTPATTPRAVMVGDVVRFLPNGAR